MNHIYKVVFCKATNTFVAVTEYARAHGKSSSGSVGSSSVAGKFSKLFALTALSSAVMLGAGAAVIDTTSGNGNIHISAGTSMTDTSRGHRNIAIGKGVGLGFVDSIMIGSDGAATGSREFSGSKSDTSTGGGASVGIGNGAQVGGGGRDAFTTAVGYKTFAAGPSVAFGAYSVADPAGGAPGPTNMSLGKMAIGTAARTGINDNTTGIAIGTLSQALATNSMAVGERAYIANNASGAEGAQAIGYQSSSLGQNALAVGNQATTGRGTASQNAISVGYKTHAVGANTIALGNNAQAGGYLKSEESAVNARVAAAEADLAIKKAARDAKAVEYNAAWNAKTTNPRVASELRDQMAEADIAFRDAEDELRRAKADQARLLGDESITDVSNAIAIGNDSKAYNVNSLAIGNNAQAYGKQSISIGVGNQVWGDNSGAFGDPSINAGTASYSFGNDNAIGSTTSSAFILGNNNAIGATATYDEFGKLQVGLGLENETNATSSIAIGNYNRITSPNTYVLGSGINTIGSGDNVSGLSGTVANSVYLGDDSDAIGSANNGVNDQGAGILKNRGLNKSGVGSTTTGGMGAVTNGTVNGVTYGTFAGTTPVGIVTVGTSGAERRIQNVAAGEISSTSTDAINGSQLYAVIDNGHFKLQGNGANVDDVKWGDTINFIDGNNTTVTVENTDKDKKISTIKIDVDVPKVETTSLTTNTNGKVDTPADDNANKLATAGDIANAINNSGWNAKSGGNKAEGDNEAATLINPGEDVEFNAGTNLKVKRVGNVFTYETDKNVVFDSVKAGPVTINNNGIDAGNTAITNVKGNLPNTYNTDAYNPNNEAVTKSQALPSDVNVNNAATVGDVLNAGWNLQGNGKEVDFVKPYDTVNFKDGANTKVVAKANDEGTSSDIQINVTGLPVQYTTKDGTPVAKVGDNYYPVDENGLPNTDADPVEAGDLITNVINPAAAPNEKGDETTLGNVKSGLETTNVPTAPTGKDGDKATSPLVNLNNEDVPDTNVATVGDLRNMGWVVSAEGNDYTDTVKNANEVKFKGTGLATVTGETTKEGVREITVNVDAQAVVEAAQQPVVYTDAEGNKLTKVDGNFYKVENIDEETGKPKDNAEAVKPADVIASMNNGDSSTTEPMTLGNVAGSLPVTYNVGDNNIGDDGKPSDTKAAAPTKSQVAPKPDDVKNIYNNAATVGDVLNAGWNLQNNGEAKDFVKPYDTVNFVNGEGTVAVVTTSDDGKISDVTYNVNVDGKTTKITYTNANGDVITKDGDKYTDADGNEVDAKDVISQVTAVAPEIKVEGSNTVTVTTNTDADGNTTYSVEANTAPLTNTNGKVDTPADGDTNKLATAGDIANAINNSGWNLAADGTAGTELINPGDTVTFKADENLTVTREGPDITYGLAKDIKVDSVQFGDNNGPTISKDGDNIKVGDKEGNPTNITNVAGNLAPTYNAGDNTIVDGKPSDTTASTPTKSAEAPTPDQIKNIYNNAATVGDVLNAGWNLQNNGEEKDFVKPYDTVNFVNGEGTVAVVTTSDDGKISDVTYNVNVDNATTYITAKDAAGNTLYQGDDGKFYTEPNGQGDVAEPVGDTYITANVSVIDAKVGSVNAKDGKAEVGAGTSPTDAAGAKSIADTINKVGFKATANKPDGADANKDGLVNAGENLNFNDGVNTKVVVEGNNVTYNVTGLPVQYTTAGGTPVAKVGDNYYPVGKDGLPDTTAAPIPADQLVTNVVNPAASPDKIGAPTKLGNIASTLPATYNDDALNPADADGKKAPVTTAQALPELTPAQLNNAATIGDVLNAGWNLQNNGEARDFVKPYDTVNFVNGKGTTAVVTTTADGKSSNVTYNANYDNLTINVGGTAYKVTQNPDGTYTYVVPSTGGTGGSTGLTVNGNPDATNNNTSPTGQGSILINGQGTHVSVDNSTGEIKVDSPLAYKGNPVNANGDQDTSTPTNTVSFVGATTDAPVQAQNLASGVRETLAGSGDALPSAYINAGTDANGNPVSATTYTPAQKQAIAAAVNNATGDTLTNAANIGDVQAAAAAAKTEVRAGENVRVDTATGDDGHTIYTVHAAAPDLSPINKRLDDIEKGANAGVSSAMAMATLPQAYIPGKSMLTGGVASYNGEGAVAVGFSKLSDNGRWVLKMSGSADTDGNIGGAVGAGFHF